MNPISDDKIDNSFMEMESLDEEISEDLTDSAIKTQECGANTLFQASESMSNSSSFSFDLVGFEDFDENELEEEIQILDDEGTMVESEGFLEDNEGTMVESEGFLEDNEGSRVESEGTIVKIGAEIVEIEAEEAEEEGTVAEEEGEFEAIRKMAELGDGSEEHQEGVAHLGHSREKNYGTQEFINRPNVDKVERAAARAKLEHQLSDAFEILGDLRTLKEPRAKSTRNPIRLQKVTEAKSPDVKRMVTLLPGRGVALIYSDSELDEGLKFEYKGVSFTITKATKEEEIKFKALWQRYAIIIKDMHDESNKQEDANPTQDKGRASTYETTSRDRIRRSGDDDEDQALEQHKKLNEKAFLRSPLEMKQLRKSAEKKRIIQEELKKEDLSKDVRKKVVVRQRQVDVQLQADVTKGLNKQNAVFNSHHLQLKGKHTLRKLHLPFQL